MENLPTTTNSQPLTLEQQISAVTEQLVPASPDAIAAAVLRLSRSGMAYPPGLDRQHAGAIYATCMRGIAIEALRRVTVKLLQGDIPNVSREFIPTAPAFAALCRSEAFHLHRDRERLQLRAESLQLGREVRSVGQDAIERVRALRQSVLDAAKRSHEEASIYSKPEDELNRIFRNKLPPEPPPPAGKWSDEQWHQQQRELENGESSQISGERDDNGPDRDRPEGQSERPFGFEDD